MGFEIETSAIQKCGQTIEAVSFSNTNPYLGTLRKMRTLLIEQKETLIENRETRQKY